MANTRRLAPAAGAGSPSCMPIPVAATALWLALALLAAAPALHALPPPAAAAGCPAGALAIPGRAHCLCPPQTPRCSGPGCVSGTHVATGRRVSGFPTVSRRVFACLHARTAANMHWRRFCNRHDGSSDAAAPRGAERCAAMRAPCTVHRPLLPCTLPINARHAHPAQRLHAAAGSAPHHATTRSRRRVL